ncbi:MAG: EamA family transporter RarD [Negativicutes bacterium]|nr:EamA family transporter RarD [Negativicutes bacterium]
MKDEQGWGVASAISAYTIWGFLPIYWKLVKAVPALEILAHRFIWSLFFMVLVLALAKRMKSFQREIREIVARPGKILGVLAAAAIITVNWLIYIWAVNDSRIIETSLGYYINPLVSVLLGIVVLKEKLSFWQKVAVLLAALGVLNLTVNFGGIPWVALSLAVTFALYGLCKKMLQIGALTSITLETLLISPAAFLYLSYLHQHAASSFDLNTPLLAGLLIGSGVITAVPMVLFSNSANRLPLSVLGFIQYLSPTIALFVGIFLYHEPFSLTHLLSFGLIWLALATFSLSRTSAFVRLESMVLRKLVSLKDMQ